MEQDTRVFYHIQMLEDWKQNVSPQEASTIQERIDELTYDIDTLDLSCPPEEIDRAINQASHYCNTNDEIWKLAVLNQFCLNLFVQWLEENCQICCVWRREALPVLRQLSINGSAIQLGEIKLIIIPVEWDWSNNGQFSIPQEWVDIPAFAGDYFIGIKADEEDIFICGYTNHEYIKNQAKYNLAERTYDISDEELKDFFHFYVLEGLLPPVNKTISYSPLSEREANSLLQQVSCLSSSSINYANLRLSFKWQKWAGLLDNETWRQALYNQLFPSLVQQLSTVFNTTWKSIEEIKHILTQQGLFLTEFLGRDNPPDNPDNNVVERCQIIDLGPLVIQKIVLIVTLRWDSDREINVDLLIRSVNNQPLPENLRLTVLDSDGEEFMECMSRNSDEALELRFSGESEDRVIISIYLEGERFREKLVL